MVTFALFITSGAGIITLTLAKRFEEKRRKSNFILRAVSRGDERFRDYHARALYSYTTGKERTALIVTKQLPLKTKSLWNRFAAYVSERANEYMGDMRDTKLLKRSDGISEFFKNISDIEKGSGEINESFQSEVSNTNTSPEAIEASTIIADIEASVPLSAPVATKPKAVRKRSPRKKKITVIEVE